MSCIRTRGNQLALVHGEREPGTGKVQQRILFTIYSKPEALEAVGKGSSGGEARFQHLLQGEFPDLSFNAKLEYLAELVAFRLRVRDQQANEWNEDNAFYWRYTLQGRDAPPDTEEHAEDCFERGEYAKAEAIFRLLTECYPGYVEGYNYLGLIAYHQHKLDQAAVHFHKTVELGRKLFAARIARKWYWRDHKTRPYMRGLCNLTMTLNERGRYQEALQLCDRLRDECADEVEAADFQAAIFLNTRQCTAAMDADRVSWRLWRGWYAHAGPEVIA